MANRNTHYPSRRPQPSPDPVGYLFGVLVVAFMVIAAAAIITGSARIVTGTIVLGIFLGFCLYMGWPKD